MKTIYFVRHGETVGNKGAFFQTPTTELTDNGREQAVFIAKRAAHLPIDAIISSPMTRAKDTAEAISKVIRKPIEFSDNFVERRLPKAQSNTRRDSPEMLNITKEVIAHFGEPDWRYSDEETFEDLKNRATAALKELAERKENHILVVTHGFFLRVMLAKVLFWDDLTPRACTDVLRATRMANTGLTVFRFGHSDAEYFGGTNSGWQVWVWNDHAHLG